MQKFIYTIIFLSFIGNSLCTNLHADSNQHTTGSSRAHGISLLNNNLRAVNTKDKSSNYTKLNINLIESKRITNLAFHELNNYSHYFYKLDKVCAIYKNMNKNLYVLFLEIYKTNCLSYGSVLNCDRTSKSSLCAIVYENYEIMHRNSKIIDDCMSIVTK